MCGIIGYIGKKEKKSLILNSLKELEYRGYDSAGLAVLKNDNLDFFKAVGKIDNLINKCSNFTSDELGVAIGHTRWATHGKANDINAHPHLGEYSCVIHNGIIENYKELKSFLKTQNINFISQTDTEIIVKLYEFYARTYEDFDAFKKVINDIKGAFAILLISKKSPNTIFFAKCAAPLIIGQKDDEVFFASSDSAIIGLCDSVVYLDDISYGYANNKELKLYQNDQIINPSFSPLNIDRKLAQKNGYRFFMEKEIYEQSDVLSEVLMGRVNGDNIVFDELDGYDMTDFNEIVFCACGTSYNAALVASYLFEKIAKIKCKVEIASEFRYKNSIIDDKTLFIVISQSGETADTLEALKIIKNKNTKTLAICNVENSSIARLADICILTRAGIEKGVASTKAFATQVMTLWMMAIYLAQKKHINIQDELNAILHIPSVCKVSKELHDKIHRLSKRCLNMHGFFYIARDVFYPLALEGALKLKELSYLHAEGYPAGEMKHGPIALVDDKLYTIALLSHLRLYDKTRSNIEELIARDSTVLVISSTDFDLSDDHIKITPQKHYMCEFFAMMIIIQLLALEISIRLGNDVDMPRNLAKSVTVE